MKNTIQKWLKESQYNFGYSRITNKIGNAYIKGKKSVTFKQNKVEVTIDFENKSISAYTLPIEMIVLEPSTKNIFFITSEEEDFINRLLYMCDYKTHIKDLLLYYGYQIIQ